VRLPALEGVAPSLLSKVGRCEVKYINTLINVGVFMIYKEKTLLEYEGKCSPKFKDLSGKQLGEYFIICRAPTSKGGATMFWTECSCGKIEQKCSTHLIRGKSSMCVQCAADKHARESFKGVGEISYAYWKQLKRGAAGEKSSRKSRKVRKFEVSIEEAWDIFERQDRMCALSGLPIKFVTVGVSNSHRMKEQTASLDRIDSNGDYTLDNIQWVHKDINRMKNVYEQEHFIMMCNAVASYMRRPL
jgi:hypothetical protein